ncbi:MAG: DUF2179 domain-containing protein [Lachnospiraceae bacterium]|nr:DUF2179 domain-containing protein [Lachnospiraceae bacterium]
MIRKLAKSILSYLAIIAGALMASFSVICILIPNDAIDYGTAGIAIITKSPDDIIKQIKEELNKTCTVLDSYGVISGENKTLICYVSYFELQKMREIISANKGSFSTVSTIDEILR